MIVVLVHVASSQGCPCIAMVGAVVTLIQLFSTSIGEESCSASLVSQISSLQYYGTQKKVFDIRKSHFCFQILCNTSVLLIACVFTFVGVHIMQVCLLRFEREICTRKSLSSHLALCNSRRCISSRTPSQFSPQADIFVFP